MRDQPDIADLASRDALSWLHGFWREEHDTLSPIPAPLVAGVRERAKRVLDIHAKVRWMVLEEWDLWRFQAEVAE